jgi:hypothetical protein
MNPREPIAGADRGDHRARDDGTDPRDAHQPFAAGIVAGQTLEYWPPPAERRFV